MSFNEFSADLQYQDDVNVFRPLQRPRNVECYAARAGGLAGGLSWERGSVGTRSSSRGMGPPGTISGQGADSS